MAQIPILNGIYTDEGPDFRTSYPVNMIPVPKSNGISEGYLRPGDGIVQTGTGPGGDRGGINWNGVCYRVMGTSLVTVSDTGMVTALGDVGGTGLVSFDYSFDRLAINSGSSLFYWNGTSLTQVTDPDLGPVIDMIWIDGYFMTTDGENIVVTELIDPTAVNPLKYGSSEADPDPVVALHKIRNEAYALNRNTIEVFDNIGGNLFPFQRIEGAQIQKGVVGTHACCVFVDSIAFLGSGRNEAPGIYLGSNSVATKISTREIDTLLLAYTESELAGVKIEAKNDRAGQQLYVHLPDRTLVFDAAATAELEGEPVWFILTSALDGFSQYRARNFVWAYDQWLCADPASGAVARLDNTVSTHLGENVRWEFATTVVYNKGAGAVFNELELVALPGRVPLGANPRVTTSYSTDGVTWGQDKTILAGTQGQRGKRLVWFQQGHMRNWRIQRFQGDTDSHLAFTRLEAMLEPLAW